ncbi:unnamed protein product [Calicophoron daubneyi]|uniref:Sorting nexin-14 n=1 Tax=Calicophoron daubneyi TaxID=300641 RepID=A0AAV2TW15_CALDB
MFLLLSIGFLFLLLGYSFKWLFNATSAAQKSFRLDDDYSDRYNDSRRKVSPVFSSPNRFFDSTRKTLGPEADAALESIFNIIMEWYILSWYRTVSDSSDFVVQVKMYLQYLCSSLIHRALMLPSKSLITEGLIERTFSHFEHVSSAVTHEKPIDPLTEERVLRSFGPYLHAALTSRSAEVAYLRSMVNRILPYASLPPALLPFNAKQTVQLLSPFLNRKRNPPPVRSQKQGRLSSQTQFRQSRSVSSGSLLPNRRSLVPLDANRAAYSFFIEILSTCVLLPAMDAVASPDFINKLIILVLDEQTDAHTPDVIKVERVPVLSAYVKEWREWLSKKPRFPSPLSNLLKEQLEVYPLMQYMKSVKCTAPMTAVLLMNDIDRRLRTDILPNDTCHEIRAQIRHILSLIRDVDKGALENSGNEQHDVEDQCVLPDSENFAFFDLPSGFEDLLMGTLRAEDTHSLTRLVHNVIWEEACHAAYDAVADRFLPMYLESPEYLAHTLGLTHRVPSLSPRLSNSPRHSSPAGSTFVFNNPLKSMFGGLTVDGTSVLDGSRVGSADEFMHLSSLKSSGEFSKHQLHAQYLLSETQTIDLSDWLVYIPGLSRPEVQPKRRLIDQLTEGVMSIPGSGNNQLSLFEHDRSLSPTLSVGRPLATLSTRESLYKNRIADQLSSLHAAGQVNTTDTALSTSTTNRTPQLSTQFMFTVRTERLVNGERQPIARVDRKYSEFYVLEQKLVEFHGSAIKQQLPKRQFAPRNFEFMESRREPFERYLQYLISQPFLRSSELLFGFLTSKADFNTSLLSDLNLGRFVKSVPMKLTKEKGQFLQDFLLGFYVSCNPQPIMLEPAEPRSFTPRPEPVITVLPSSGVGVLGGYDCLASPNHYAVDANSKFRRNRSICSTTVHKPLVDMSVGNSVVSSWYNNKAAPTSLDNRLRSRLYWNNASLPPDRLGNPENSSTILNVTRLNGLSEMLFFVVEKLLVPVQTKKSQVTAESKSENSGAQANAGEEKTIRKGNTEHSIHKDPTEIRENTWNEALLNAPTLPDTPDGDVMIVRHDMNPTTPEERAPDVPTEIPTPIPKATDIPGSIVSISLSDLFTSISFAISLVKEYVSTRTRRLILWTMRVLWFYFKLPLDQWLATKLDSYVQASLVDSQLAASLRLLEATLFHSYPPSTEAERLERKSHAYTLIKTAALKLASVGISDSSAMEQKLGRLFVSFQQPKWNKQLSYVLLDQLITELFPELDRPTLNAVDGLSS